MHVLVVHTEPRFFREIKTLLGQARAEGAYLSSLGDLHLQLEAQYPDLIVLDRRCLNAGHSQLSEAFVAGPKLPLIFLTAADSQQISAGEERQRLQDLIAYLNSHGERTRASQVIQVGQMRLHEGRMRASMGDSWIKLPPIQFRLLRYLALNANVVVSHHDLTGAVWGAEVADDETKRDLIKVHIVQLRRTLGPGFKNYIQAVRGQGYVLVDPDAEE